jgi:O-acetyl-ADP-ribose deacetylase (regulator of RNase III)
MTEWAGNILDYAGRFDVIAHQVNCQGIMGGGLAFQIKNKWPEVFKEYTDFIERTGLPKSQILGRCQLVQTGCGFLANLFGQYTTGWGRQTDYEALFRALQSLRDQMMAIGLKSVAFPMKLGCGLAGGDWEVVYGLIKGTFEGSRISIAFVEYQPV